MSDTWNSYSIPRFGHLSFFLNFNFHDQVLLTWHIFSLPRLFFLVSMRVLCSKIHGCFLGFNLILQVSGTWHVFSIPCLQTFVFFNINFFFTSVEHLEKFYISVQTLVLFFISIFLHHVSNTWRLFSFSNFFFLVIISNTESSKNTCLFFKFQFSLYKCFLRTPC